MTYSGIWHTTSDMSNFSKIFEAHEFSVTHKRPLFSYGSKHKRRRLYSQQSFHLQTFSHVLVVLTLFLFTALLVNFCIFSPGIYRNHAAIF